MFCLISILVLDPLMRFTTISVQFFLIYSYKALYINLFQKQEQDSISEDCLYAKNAADVNLELAEDIGKQNNLLNARSKFFNNKHTLFFNSSAKFYVSCVFLLIIVQELELENRKLRAEASASMSLPIPPPPPPPPLPPPSFNPIK